MTKAGRKTQEMKHVSFRMPARVHQDYVAIAETRGVDLSALLNWVVVEYWPMLLVKHAQHGGAMLRAAVIGLPPGAGTGPNSQEALERVNELIRQLQEVAGKLVDQTGDGQRREAG
jgi:hypothetical protein